MSAAASGSHNYHYQALGKRCAKCGEFKPAAEFYAKAAGKDGLHSQCRTCLILAARLRRKLKAEAKQRYEAQHPELQRQRIFERFMSKVVWNGDEDECWIWEASRSVYGYGKFGNGKQSWSPAHRVAYELFVGPIPDGLHIDHLCRVRECVNPAHLEPVTCRENLLRGNTIQARNAAKTHCVHGHPLSGENLYVDKRGSRSCWTCKRAAKRRYAAEAKAKAEAAA